MQPSTVPMGADNKPRFDVNNYRLYRRLDLEYAIEWNRLKGHDIPEVKDNVSKDKLMHFCEYHNIDMGLCELYRNMQNEVRVKRPPRPKIEAEESKEPTIADLRAMAKEKGINSFGKSKDQLLEELNEQNAS